jgi:predicted nucleic acid-binding protein
VIDASVIAKLIMREENYVEAAGEIEADDETLDLAILEVANVILKYHRRGFSLLMRCGRNLKSSGSFQKRSEFLVSRNS